MVRQLGQVSYNTFVKGLITEAGPLTFPDNATIEDMNCVLTLKGSHRRRYGISEEVDGREFETYEKPSEKVLFTKNLDVNTFLWKNPDNQGKLNFLVTQINKTLFFFKVFTETKEISFIPHLTVDLTAHIVDEEFFLQKPCSFVAAKGFLFIAGEGLQPCKVTYNKEKDALSLDTIRVLIRDVDGVDDALSIDAQPGTLTELHKYNLYNQGWLYPNQLSLTSVEPGSRGVLVWTHSFYCRVTVYSFFVGASTKPFATFSEYASSGDKFEVSASKIVSIWNSFTEEQRFGFKASNIGQDVYFDKENAEIETPEGSLYIKLEYKNGSHNRMVDAYGTLGGSAVIQNLNYTQTPIGDYFASTKRIPSNVQQWFVGREVEQKINVKEVQNHDFGSQPAPKGRFTIDAFTLDRSYYIKEAGSIEDKKRAVDIAFLSGRIFYLKDNQVLFSQVLTPTLNREGLCYQEGDPTSENSFDLVDSDGGFIQINDMGLAVALFETSNGLLVFANNGIWLISGLSEDEGFKATSFAVRKLSSIDCISKKALVDVEGSPVFWSSSGIYTIQKQELGGLQVVSLSANTIQSLYKRIPYHNLQNVKGVYDKGMQKVYWLYDITDEGDSVANRYTKGLVFDVRLQAFYEMDISSDASYPYICGSFNTPWLEAISFNEEVFDNEKEIVYDADGDVVYTKKEIPNSSLTDVKFLAYQKQKDNTLRFTVCSFNDTSFTDWKTSKREGLPYESYFTTGYNTAGESDSKKDIVYLTTQLSRTEDAYEETALANRSSCQMQIRWDYENTSYSGKWTKPIQIYRANRLFAPTLEDPNYDLRGLPVVTTKHKVRGNGRAIQIKFTSEPGKNFEVLGWSMILGNRK